MAGIAGIISPEPADICLERLDAMLTAMAHGDHAQAETIHVEEMGVHLGWTVPKDRSGVPAFGNSKDGTVSLLLSGECFQAGPAGIDALVNTYLQDSDRFFENLNGMFGGLLIDRKKKQAFLFNDRFGIERIYLHEKNDTLYFASEAKALLAVLPEQKTFNDQGVAEFLTYGCTLHWKTLFSGIHLLPGGSLWTIENKRWSKGAYFSPEEWERQEKYSFEDFSGAFTETFNRILPRYVDQTPIGISLTGGLDSRMIVSGLPQDIPPPICYTYISENETLDSRLAEQVASQCGLYHRLLRLEPDFFSGFAEQADRTVFRTDGCAGILGSHEIYLSRKARELSPIRLTGNYGSEILRDMSTFKPVNIDPQLFSPEIRQAVEKCRQTPIRNRENPVSFALFKEIPWNLSGTLIAGRSQLTFRTPYLDNDLVELTFRAPDEARQTVRTALELVNHNSRALAAIPTNQGILIDGSGPAYQIRRTAYTLNSKLDYYCNEGLPDSLTRLDPLLNVMKRHSRFFGRHSFMHYRRWFRDELADYIRGALNDASSTTSPYWNPDVLKTLADDHIHGRKNRLREINAVLTLHAVERLLLN